MYEFVISKKISVFIKANSLARAKWIFREEFKSHDFPDVIHKLASFEPYDIAYTIERDRRGEK